MKDVHELEIYGCIEDYHDYLVTSNGRVLSLKYRKIRELKQGKDKNGYKLVTLSKNGKQKSFNTHLLVAKAFVPNPQNKIDVNHIDECRSNNNVLNLEWLSHKENCVKRTSNKNVRKPVLGINKHGEYIFLLSCSHGENMGFLNEGINQCCRNKMSTYKGYKWYYLKDFICKYNKFILISECEKKC